MAAWLGTVCAVNDILEKVPPAPAVERLTDSIDILVARREIDQHCQSIRPHTRCIDIEMLKIYQNAQLSIHLPVKLNPSSLYSVIIASNI